MGQYCFARWRLSSSSPVTLPAGRPAGRRARGWPARRRSGAWAVGGRHCTAGQYAIPVRSTTCYYFIVIMYYSIFVYLICYLIYLYHFITNYISHEIWSSQHKTYQITVISFVLSEDFYTPVAPEVNNRSSNSRSIIYNPCLITCSYRLWYLPTSEGAVQRGKQPWIRHNKLKVIKK